MSHYDVDDDETTMRWWEYPVLAVALACLAVVAILLGVFGHCDNRRRG